MLGHLEAERTGIAVQLGAPAPRPPEEAVGRVVVHRERPRGEAEALDQRHRQSVRLRESHRTGLGPEPGRERLPEREDPPADALLRLDEDRVVACSRELGRRDQPCHPGPDDDHARGLGGVRREAVRQHAEVLVDGARHDHGGRLPIAAGGRIRDTSVRFVTDTSGDEEGTMTTSISSSWPGSRGPHQRAPRPSTRSPPRSCGARWRPSASRWPPTCRAPRPRRSSTSRNERNATILDAQGRLAALSVGIPQFMLTSTLPVRFALDFLGVDEFREGDVFVANDPYHGGGHLPDYNVFAPVFADDPTRPGRARAWCSSRASSATTATPAAACPAATTSPPNDIWGEGVRWPVVKVIDRGVERRDVLYALQANNRIPDYIGDLRGADRRRAARGATPRRDASTATARAPSRSRSTP